MRTQIFGLLASTFLVLGGTVFSACSDATPSASGQSGSGNGGSTAMGSSGSGSVAGSGVSAGGSNVAGSGAGGSPSAGAGGSAAGATNGGSGGAAGGASGGSAGSLGTAGSGGGSGTPSKRVVAYLPNYSGSYADWANKIDFTKMTHLNLAFADAKDNNDWDMGASDNDVKALVDKAHAAGVKVLASLGGGGGDQTVISRWKASPDNIAPMVQNLDNFLKRLNLDGADVDIEDGGQLGDNYGNFVSKIVSTLHPEGKLVTVAIAQYLQGGMADSTLHQFDFINVMIYTNNMSDFTNEMKWYSDTKQVPKSQLTAGAGFFGTDSGDNEYSYSDIMAADGSAWSKNQTSVKGQQVNYTGVQLMKDLANFSKGYGGIMFWELSEDVPGDHSLWKAIQDTM